MRIWNLRTYMWPVLALAAVSYLSLAAARSARAASPAPAPAGIERPVPLDPGEIPCPAP